MLHARYIGQNVHTAETLHGKIHQAAAILPPGQVAHKGYAAQLAGRLNEQSLVHIGHDDLRALLTQRLSHRIADTAGSAGNNSSLFK